MSQENIHANDAGSQMQLAADGRGVDVRQSPEADTLYVRYDGEALRSHEMDVKQLAPALLSPRQSIRHHAERRGSRGSRASQRTGDP